MSKPVISFCRPIQWRDYSSDNLAHQFVWLPLCGEYPSLRDGTPAYDSVGMMMSDDGLNSTLGFFKYYKPEFFLFPPIYANDGTTTKIRGVISFLDKLKNASPDTKFIYWNGNQQGVVDFNVEGFRPFINIIVTNTDEPSEREMFSRIGVDKVYTFHQFGFDPKEHGKSIIEPEYDAMFAGSQTFSKGCGKYPNSKWRNDFVERVAKNFNLGVYGKGAWTFKKVKFAIGHALYDAFSSAQVVIGGNHWDYRKYYTRRLVYALASGRPYVTRYIPGMEEDFVNGVELLWFADDSDGIDQIRRMIKDPDVAKKIGAKGREYAVNHFSWHAMMRKLDKLLSGA